MERHLIRTILKAIIKLNTILTSGKDTVPDSKRRCVVYEIPCGNCEHKYVGATKRSRVLDWKNTTGTPYLNIFLKTQKKQR